jgi:hypothetical protein
MRDQAKREQVRKEQLVEQGERDTSDTSTGQLWHASAGSDEAPKNAIAFAWSSTQSRLCASDAAKKASYTAMLFVCGDWKRSTGQLWHASAGSDDAPKSAIAFVWFSHAHATSSIGSAQAAFEL